MKAAIVIAALLASTAAQAQSIKMIAREDGYTVALTDMPCKAASWQKTAVFNNYGKEGGHAFGCWHGTRSQVELSWFDVRTKRELPEILPALLFEEIKD